MRGNILAWIHKFELKMKLVYTNQEKKEKM
jgi:hypothetical protein